MLYSGNGKKSPETFLSFFPPDITLSYPACFPGTPSIPSAIPFAGLWKGVSA